MPRGKRLPKSIVVLTDETGNITNIACAITEPEKKDRNKISRPLAPKKPAPTIRIEHGDFKISFN